MFSKLFIFASLLASGIAYGPNCKVETEEVETQLCHIAPTNLCGVEEGGVLVAQHVELDKVCVDIVDKYCVPALVAADGCTEVTRNVCLPTTKLVDTPSLEIPAPYNSEHICRILPKGTCVAKVNIVYKTVCEPVELPKLVYHGLPLVYG